MCHYEHMTENLMESTSLDEGETKYGVLKPETVEIQGQAVVKTSM